MNFNLVVSKSIEINANQTKVWDAMTNPELIKKYLFGTETITDWKIGSEIIFQGEYNGIKYRDRGIVRENIQNKLLSYSYWSGFLGIEDKPENYSLVTYTIEKIDNDKTKLTWSQKGFASEEGYKHTESGLDALLGGIKSLVEGAKA